MLGVELLDGAAIAVVADEAGVVSARAEIESSDAASAARDAIQRVAPADKTTRLAAAAPLPERPSSVKAFESLAASLAGRLARDRPIASGTAAAVAECWAGAARGARDVVYFGVGDHVSAGIVRQGEPVIGRHGFGPFAAWMALNPVEREDYRKIGCLEAEVAAAGIVRRLVWRVKAGDRSRVMDAAAGDVNAISTAQILDAARDGDGVSISVIRDTAKYLGMAAANLVAIADPEVLVVGGIMATAPDLLLEPVRVELSRRLPTAMAQTLTILTATLGPDAPALGAARMSASAASPR
jgi:predicted NBD/HSP70 family sugar kinase